MEIAIKGLGAIESAKIDLDKRLTIFCGRNNTGKTYMSYVIYALTRVEPPINHQLSLSKEQVSKLYNHETISVHIEPSDILKYKAYVADYVLNNIGEIFGIGSEEATRLFSKLKIEFTTDIGRVNEKLTACSLNYSLYFFDATLNISKLSGSLDIGVSFSLTPSTEIGNNPSVFQKFLPYFIVQSILRYLAIYPISKSYCLPVERNSIYTFNRELSITRNKLIEQLQKGVNNPMFMVDNQSNRYPQPIVDGINIANDLTNIKKTKGHFFDLATKIEADIMNGNLDISTAGDVVFSSNNVRGRKLPIHLTASLIKTLSSLVFYLKHIARENELIIIDEPEMNLHPDTQIALVAVLVELINNGVRLLISTHSDYILREINKYVMLGEIPEESMPEFARGLKLPKEDVGVYYFTHRQNKKVSVKNIPVGKNGFNVPSFDEAAERQNDEILQIYSLMS